MRGRYLSEWDPAYRSTDLEINNLKRELIMESKLASYNNEIEVRPEGNLPSGVYMLLLRLGLNIFSSQVVKVQ